MENNKQQKNTALIRIILCVAVMIILFLDIFKIVSRKITLPVSSVLLIAVAIWNGIEYFKSGKKKNCCGYFYNGGSSSGSFGRIFYIAGHIM